MIAWPTIFPVLFKPIHRGFQTCITLRYETDSPYLPRSLFIPKVILALLWTQENVSNISLSIHLHDITYRKCLGHNGQTDTIMSIKHFYTLVMDVSLLKKQK